MYKNHFLLLNKVKNTVSAQLCERVARELESYREKRENMSCTHKVLRLSYRREIKSGYIGFPPSSPPLSLSLSLSLQRQPSSTCLDVSMSCGQLSLLLAPSLLILLYPGLRGKVFSFQSWSG